MMNDGIQPVVNLATQNGNGYNDGFGGDYGFWWIIIILFALFGWGNNGFGGNNGTSSEIFTTDEFIKRDLFGINQNVSDSACQTQRDVLSSQTQLASDIVENRYTNQLGLQGLGQQIQSASCSTDKEILQNRYDNAIQTNTLQSQISQCCCDLQAQGLANTQRILDAMCQTQIDTLREQLQTANIQISQQVQQDNLINALRPTPAPSYLVSSPYASYVPYGTPVMTFNGSCGCNNF